MTRFEKRLIAALWVIIAAIFAAALCGCVGARDALVPDEMCVYAEGGKIHSGYLDDPHTSQIGVAFTWDLRKDIRNEIRLLRKEFQERGLQRDN